MGDSTAMITVFDIVTSFVDHLLLLPAAAYNLIANVWPYDSLAFYL